jgi:hypothetical protein
MMELRMFLLQCKLTLKIQNYKSTHVAYWAPYSCTPRKIQVKEFKSTFSKSDVAFSQQAIGTILTVMKSHNTNPGVQCYALFALNGITAQNGK